MCQSGCARAEGLLTCITARKVNKERRKKRGEKREREGRGWGRGKESTRVIAAVQYLPHDCIFGLKTLDVSLAGLRDHESKD